jgi:pyridoxine 4-dehydrogenase
MSTKVSFQKNFTIGGRPDRPRMGYGAMRITGKGIWGQLKVTPHQLALSWLLYHSPNNLLIPGTSSVKHLEENLEAEKIQLTDELLEELER